MNAATRRKLKRIQALIFDVDGVLTDGGLYYGPDGEVMKRFSVRDGHGLVMCRIVGFKTGILTARTSTIVERRGKELGVTYVMQGKRQKGPAFIELAQTLRVEPSQCLYIGDDVNDLPALLLAGVSACPADAHPEVRKQVDYVCDAGGGRGAVREIIDLTLKATGHWDEAMEHARPPA